MRRQIAVWSFTWEPVLTVRGGIQLVWFRRSPVQSPIKGGHSAPRDTKIQENTRYRICNLRCPTDDLEIGTTVGVISVFSEEVELSRSSFMCASLPIAPRAKLMRKSVIVTDRPIDMHAIRPSGWWNATATSRPAKTERNRSILPDPLMKRATAEADL
jgi:hypothetical protein